MGIRLTKDRVQRVADADNFDGAKFQNKLPTDLAFSKIGKIMADQMRKPKHATPLEPLEVIVKSKGDFSEETKKGLNITWLGHSTTIIEIDGFRVLTDPVWSERASPTSFAGPARFHKPPLPLDELPDIDAVILSHDHYDHLDETTVKTLGERGLKFFTPYGVGQRLVEWGVPKKQVKEFNWWEGTHLGDLHLMAVPARHFSGRGMTDRFRTLWASWVIRTPEHTVFFSGDTGMHEDFLEIGQRFGPFDLVMMENGAYNPLWADVHIGPEQAVLAHQQLGGRVLMPIHWGTFDLAMHGWTEPAERLIIEAAKQEVRLAFPKIGERFAIPLTEKTNKWWPKLDFATAQDKPQISSHLEPAFLVTSEKAIRSPKDKPKNMNQEHFKQQLQEGEQMQLLNETTALKRLNGTTEHVSDYRGKVLLIVNTASECGFTPQFEGLEKLWDDYKEKDFMVLGFPCNQFGGQEPLEGENIKTFCQKNYGVSFPMFSKIDVNGADAHPLYEELKSAAPGILGTKAIKWNFTKFLVDKDGRVVKRFGSKDKPESLRKEIEQLLK